MTIDPGHPPTLRCGLPRRGPASSTRFVLPFRYRPVDDEEHRCRPFYSPRPPEQIDPGARRRHYLTPETAKALFHRARWFQLCWSGRPQPDLSFDVQRRQSGGGSYRVEIAPPRLALFEWAKAEARDAFQTLATGFLVLDLVFPDARRTPTLDDLMVLNELFRNWREPFPGHDRERGYRRILGDAPMSLEPGARRLDRAISGTKPDPYFDRWASLLEYPLRLKDSDTGAVRWLRLFPERWSQQARRWCRDPLPPIGTREREPNGWVVYADSRTFVWTCALLPRGATDLAASSAEPSAPPSANGRWIKLLNVDLPGESPEASSTFEREWARERTYRRWEEAGTLYGFTFHSGAMLGPPVDPPPLYRHFAELYFDEILLLLYLRVTSFRFSERLSALSGEIGDRDDRELMEEFRDLRRAFAAFTNLYEFPLISNQEQAIEMYSLARQHLDIKDFFDELEDEIKSAHQYFEMVESQVQSRETLVLTVIATLGIPAAVVTGFFGMNIFVGPLFAGDGPLMEGLAVVLAFLAGVLSIVLFSRWTTRYRELVTNILLGRTDSSRSRKGLRR